MMVMIKYFYWTFRVFDCMISSLNVQVKSERDKHHRSTDDQPTEHV